MVCSVAIIPARGGSQRIPRKNIVTFAGLPLIAHSIRHAVQSRYVSAVYVTTDDPEIAAISRDFGSKVIERPSNLAQATCSSESALLHALDHISEDEEKIDYVVFLQCTSPIRSSYDIDRCLELAHYSGYDSVFSACEDLGLFWQQTQEGLLAPINYDPAHRKREQDMARQFRENGSIFVFRPSILRRFNCRMGGKIGLYEMDKLSSFQVDVPQDLILLEAILLSLNRRSICNEWHGI